MYIHTGMATACHSHYSIAQTKMIRICLIVFLSGVLVGLSHGSQKRGFSLTSKKFMCGDFNLFNSLTWWYDWGKNVTDFLNNTDCLDEIEEATKKYVPMIWSYYPKTEVYLQPNTSYVLGFNEPNHKKQANRTPKKAAEYWKKVEEKSEGRELISPAAAPCGTDCLGNTVDWFDQFFGNCTNCTFHYLATHLYYCNVDQVMDFLWMLYKRYGMKIWLTEFACGNKNPDPAPQLDFMKKILPRLEKAKHIYKYAWFTARIDNDDKYVTSAASLLKPTTSELTELGRYYVDYIYTG